MINIHGTKTKPLDYELYIDSNAEFNVSFLSSYESYQFKFAEINFSTQPFLNSLIFCLSLCNYIFIFFTLP